MNGFKTFNEFVNAWIKGEYPKFEKNEQVEKMLVQLREGNNFCIFVTMHFLVSSLPIVPTQSGE